MHPLQPPLCPRLIALYMQIYRNQRSLNYLTKPRSRLCIFTFAAALGSLHGIFFLAHNYRFLFSVVREVAANFGMGYKEKASTEGIYFIEGLKTHSGINEAK